MTQRFVMPLEQAYDDDGASIPGAKLNFYITQTLTRKDTFSDSALTTPNDNPVIAESDGRFADIFPEQTESYKVVYTDADDNEIWTADPVTFGTESVIYNQGGTGAVDRTIQSRLQDVVSVKDFGATGDGTDETTEITAAVTYWRSLQSGIFNEAYPTTAQIGLYFPSGHYVASGLTIESNGTGALILGDGINSQLDGITISIKDRVCEVYNLLLRGAGTDGLLIDATTNDVRGGLFHNLWIKDKTNGIHLNSGAGSNAHCKFNHVYVEGTAFGMLVENTSGFHAVDCHFINITDTGVRITGGEEHKFTCCTSFGCDRHTLWITGQSSSIALGFYSTNCTWSGAGATAQDSYTIASVATNGAGGSTVTLTGNHTLTEGMQGTVISGTTTYDGTHDVFNVIDDAFDIAVVFVADPGTGTVVRPAWEVVLEGLDAPARCNDMYFDGGNINFIKLDNVYNAKFNNARVKQQLYLTDSVGTGCNRIIRMGPSRGRQTNSSLDIQISGQNTGFADIVYTDPTGAGFGPGDGGIRMTAPDKSVAMIGNLPQAYNEVFVAEDGIEFSSEELSHAMNANGLKHDSQYSHTSGAIADDIAYSFTPPFASGVAIVTTGLGDIADMAQIAYNTATPTMADAGFLGADTELTTGVLANGAGTDVKITLSVHTDGAFYISNRTGSSQTFWVTFVR